MGRLVMKCDYCQNECKWYIEVKLTGFSSEGKPSLIIAKKCEKCVKWKRDKKTKGNEND